MTPQVKSPPTTDAPLSTRAGRRNRRSGGWSQALGLKSSYRLSAACAAAGVLMIVGGAAGSSGDASHSQIVSPAVMSTASAKELVQVPLTETARSQPVTVQPAEIHQPAEARPPSAPRPVEPQQPQKPQPPHGPSDASFYKHCAEALTPGPPPNPGRGPGHSVLDRDNDGKACEN